MRRCIGMVLDFQAYVIERKTSFTVAFRKSAPHTLGDSSQNCARLWNSSDLLGCFGFYGIIWEFLDSFGIILDF